MTVFLDEKDEKIQRRKVSSDLKICGEGVLILLLWSFVRFLLSANINDEAVSFFNGEIQSVGVSAAVYWLVFFALASIVIAIHVYVVLCAIAESRGKKKGYFYLVVCVLLLCSSAYSILDLFLDTQAYTTWLDHVLSFFTEALSMAVEIGVIVNSVKIKKLRKIIGGEEK